MRFNETKLRGAYIIEPELIEDERGSFARTWCEREFGERGLNPSLAQCSISYNVRKGTLRGMHWQAAPHEEAKLVRCTRGAVYDVIIDMRPTSSTRLQWVSALLTAENRMMLYIPEGFAHGFQTLEDNTEIFYQISEHFHSESGRGVRWNDPAFRIEWPDCDHRIMNARDQSYPNITP